jgi:hypothetical protein
MKKQIVKLTATVLLCAGVAHAQYVPPLDNQAAPVAAPAAVADKVEFKLRWQAGKQYLVKIRSEQKISQTIDNKLMVVDQTTGFTYLYDVKDVDAQGAANVEMTFRDVLFKVVIHNEKAPFTIEYDSTKKPLVEAPPAASGIAAMAGQKVQLKITPQGRTLEAKGFKELLEHMIKSIKVPAGNERAMMEGMMKSQFSEDSLKDMLEKGMSGTYPAHPVAIGESWTSATSLKSNLPMQLAATFTLTERKNGIATISQESTMAMDSKDKPIQVADSKTAINLEGKLSGTTQLRESDGWIVRSLTRMDFAGAVVVSTQPTSPGDLRPPSKKSWPMSITGTTTVESQDL